MIEMSSGVIYGMFAFFVVVGALLGLKRGLTKAVIRAITVLIAGIAVVFLVTPISSAILSADLSDTGLVIGNIPVTTINETIINYISSIAGIGQLLLASPTLVVLIKAVPMLLVNLILFVLLFFVAKGILYFIDIILNRIIIKKDSDKPVRRLWGALVGAVQGIICFLFVLMPIAGTMNLLDETMDLITYEAANTQAVSMTGNPLTSSVSMVEAQQGETMTIDEFPEYATNAVDAYQDIFIIKLFNAVGYRAITDSVFDRLTTIEVGKDTKTNLRAESQVIAKVYNNYDKLKDVDLAKFTAQNQTDANQLIDDAFSSPIISGVTTELVKELASVWTAAEPSTFIGIAKPEMNEDLIKTFDVLLLSLRNSTKDDLSKDLKVIVGTIKVSADYHLTENIASADPDTIVTIIGQEGCMENIIGTLASGKSTKQAIPSLVEFGLSYGYSAVGLDGSEIQVNKTAEQINWDREQVVLGNLFEGVGTTYLSTKGTGEPITRLDFDGLAKILTSIRDSQLLSEVGQDISIKLLSSKLTVGIDVDTLVSYISNDTTYRDIDFPVMLAAVKSTASIAGDMNEILSGSGEVSQLNPDDIGSLLNALTSNESTKDVLNDLVGQENLKKAGADDKTAGAVNGLVNAITSYDITAPGAEQIPTTQEELQSATSAVEKLVEVSSSANDLSTEYIFGEEEFAAKEKMTDFIETMLSNKFIYASTIGGGEALGFKSGETSNLSPSEKVWLVEVLRYQEANNPNCTELNCIEIAEMFAVNYQ